MRAKRKDIHIRDYSDFVIVYFGDGGEKESAPQIVDAAGGDGGERGTVGHKHTPHIKCLIG